MKFKKRLDDLHYPYRASSEIAHSIQRFRPLGEDSMKLLLPQVDLLLKIKNHRAQVAVIGLGYVGLPLALRAAKVGFDVLGIDVDEILVHELSKGRSASLDIDRKELSAEVESGRFTVTSETARLAAADIIIICVPTPLAQELPDISYVRSAAKSVAEHLKPGQLVILESTTYPGTTEELLLSTLESSQLRGGSDFYLGFSPERIDPGNPDFKLQDLPKLVGGINKMSTDLMEEFYGSFIKKVVRVSSPKTAEMAKLLENTYRHVNIALANEMAILCHDLDIDIWEVIEAAATKPFGFQPFYPGPGWGGHCIPVDPAYLSWRVRQMGSTARFVDLAREFNERMPTYVVQRIAEALNEHGKSVKSASILVLGVAYKANVADLRESPAIEIIERTRKAGAVVSFHDPYVVELSLKTGPLGRVRLDAPTLASADLVLVHTDHSFYDWQLVADNCRLVLDTRNALRGIEGPVVKL